MSRAGDPGSLMNSQCHIPPVDWYCLTSVQTHAHTDSHVRGPRFGEQGSLSGNASGDSRLGPSEREEQSIALGVHLHAALAGHSAPEELPVPLQYPGVAIPDTPKQPSRTLDVSKHKGHSPAGKGGIDA